MTTAPDPTPTRLDVAARLLDAGCVTLRTDEPFRLPSGWATPVYMDCRRLISFPEARRALVGHAIELLKADGCLAGLGSIAGGESSCIALAAWIADALDLPMQYVRKRAVGARQVEGVVRAGERALLVDDMMAAGASKANFARALRAAGAEVGDVLVLFDYGMFGADRMLAALGLKVHALANWHDIRAVAAQRGSFGREVIAEFDDFLRDPVAWSAAHGGKGFVTEHIESNAP
jgi:orotate phosphoribosyltransferase